MSSKAERLRRKKEAKAKADPFALAPIERREPNGRGQRDAIDRDPSIPALMVRCRIAAKDVNQDNLRDMRAPWNGCNAGQAIADLGKDERDYLWTAICHMRRVIVAFDNAIGAPSRHAKCANIIAPVDAMEADASSPPLDERTEAERQRHATSALMALEGWLGWCDKADAWQAKRVVWDDMRVTDKPGLLSALRSVSDGLRGQRMVYRAKA